MSGFEVAGIVLGSLPLLVTALEAYSRFMRSWGQIPSELRSLNRQLTTERAKLYNVCGLLINDVVSQRDIEPMLQNPFGSLWRAPGTNEKIRRRLWDSYDPFEQGIAEIQEALNSIMRRLRVQVSPDGQVEWVNKNRMTQEFKKLLYRIHRDDYKDDIAVISNGISDLESLVKMSVILEPSRRKQSRGKLFKILRDLSTSVYRALCSSIICAHPHKVSLGLCPRFIEIGYDCEDENVMRDVQFEMVISFEMVEGRAMKQFWDEVNIKTATPVTTIEPQACLPQPRPKRIKRVLFDFRQRLSFMKSPKSTHRVKIALATMSHPVTDFAFRTCHEDGSQKQPLDLCMALRNARTARPLCYGHLIDKECVGRQFQVYPLGTTVNSDCWSVVSLDDILKGKKGLRPLVSLAEKVQLALAVASSVLQLSKTPWLPEALTRKNVHFFRRDESLSYQYPFLPRNFPASPVHTSSTVREYTYPNNPTLFALGILLLEIILGQYFEQLRPPLGQVLYGDPDGIIRDSIAAHKLLERVALISTSYQVVVQRCIDCTETRGLDDDAFRQEVYNDIVMELEAMVDSTKIGM